MNSILDIIKQHYPNTKVDYAEFDGDSLKVSMYGNIRYYKIINNEIYILKPKLLESSEHSSKLKAIIREAKINIIID